MTEKKAAFIVGFLDESGDVIAATTRIDKIDSIGLPGGKVEKGESPFDAALREAFEEGWDFSDCEVLHNPVYQEVIEDYLVYWFVCISGKPKKLDEFKEKHRGIRPVEFSRSVLVDYGNDRAIPEAWKVFLSYHPKEIAESSIWNRYLIQNQLNSFGIHEDISKVDSRRFCDILSEAARKSSKRVLKLMKQYDIAFVTAFRGFENLSPLSGEEMLRVKDVNDLPVEFRNEIADKIRKTHSDFDRLSKLEQDKLISLELDRWRRMTALTRNRKRNKELENKIRSSPSQYSYIPVNGAYHETQNDGSSKLAEEESFIVIDRHGVGTLRDDVIRWGKEYEQEAVLFKPKDGEDEMIYTGKSSDKENPGDIRAKFQAILFDDSSVYLDKKKNWTQLNGKRNFYFIQTDVPPQNKEFQIPSDELKKKVFEKFYSNR